MAHLSSTFSQLLGENQLNSLNRLLPNGAQVTAFGPTTPHRRFDASTTFPFIDNYQVNGKLWHLSSLRGQPRRSTRQEDRPYRPILRLPSSTFHPPPSTLCLSSSAFILCLPSASFPSQPSHVPIPGCLIQPPASAASSGPAASDSPTLSVLCSVSNGRAPQPYRSLSTRPHVTSHRPHVTPHHQSAT